MSKQAVSYRKALPTRRELRDQINMREIARDIRVGSWGAPVERIWR